MNDINIKELIKGFGNNSLHFTQYMNKIKTTEPVLYGRLLQELENGSYKVSILQPGVGQ